MADDRTDRSVRHPRVLEWDENKRQRNIDKHGIDFLDAVEAMSDPGQLTYRSDHPENEVHYITVGRIKELTVAVVFTVRERAVRIISVRRARKSERERYEQG